MRFNEQDCEVRHFLLLNFLIVTKIIIILLLYWFLLLLTYYSYYCSPYNYNNNNDDNNDKHYTNIYIFSTFDLILHACNILPLQMKRGQKNADHLSRPCKRQASPTEVERTSETL